MKTLISIAVLTFISSPVSGAVCAQPGFAQGAVPELAQMINDYRAKNGVGRLELSPALAAAAQTHACAMVASNRFTHDGNGGATARMKRAGCKTRKTGENIAMGFASPAKTLQLWIDSAPHRKILLMRGMSRIGIGVADAAPGQGGGPRWVFDVAAGC